MSASYGLNLQRWFRKCFYDMEIPGKEGTVAFQELKKFFQKVNYKVSNNLLKDRISSYNEDKSGDLVFDDFCSLVRDMIYPKCMFETNFDKYSADKQKVTLQERDWA